MLQKRDVAAAIKKLRGGRTQKDVAEQAGIDRPTWNQYEKARSMPKRSNFEKILRGLECTPRELDEAIMAAWRRRLDEEHPTQDPAPRGAGELSDLVSGRSDPRDAGQERIRHHTSALASHLEALLLMLRDAAKSPPPPEDSESR